MFQEPVYARNTYVVEMFHLIAHQSRSQQRFFRDGNVAGSRGDHKDRALPGNLLGALDRNDTRERMEDGYAAYPLDRGEDILVRASDQNIVARILLAEHRSHNFRDLIRSLALAENYLGVPLPERA